MLSSRHWTALDQKQNLMWLFIPPVWFTPDTLVGSEELSSGSSLQNTQQMSVLKIGEL